MNNESDAQILSLFPTPLYTCKLVNDEYNSVQTELQSIVDNLYVNNEWGQNLSWNSTEHFLSNKGNFEKSILQEEAMSVVTSVIMQHCLTFMKSMQVKQPYKPAIVSSWLTLTKPGLHAHIHDHGTNQISGVYWFKTNGKDGDIFFRNALKALKCNPIGSSVANETQFPPEQGRIVMWPSYLDHGVYENKTNEDRISLSFNIVLERGIT